MNPAEIRAELRSTAKCEARDAAFDLEREQDARRLLREVERVRRQVAA